MSGKDIPYFKIKYGFMPTWTLIEAAHLLLGIDPQNSTYEISPIAGNKVSLLCYWLRQKRTENKFGTTVIRLSERNMRYEPSQLFHCMKGEGNAYDKDIEKIVSARLSNNPSTQIKSGIERAIYRRAAHLLWKQHPNLYASDMAEKLLELPEHLQNIFAIELRKKTQTSIEEYLKGLAPHKKGAPRKTADRKAEIDWPYLIENM